MSRSAILGGLLVLAGCIPPPEPAPPPDPGMVAVAAQLCPAMWRWQLSVGRIMNDMSGASFQEPDPEARRNLYLDAFGEVRELNAQLLDEIAGVEPGPFRDLLIEDVVNGLSRAASIIDETEEELGRWYASVPPPTYREIVPAIFTRFEKVIDVPKPELAGYANPDLTNAFMAVVQCQHGVKDADDGVPRHVPLG